MDTDYIVDEVERQGLITGQSIRIAHCPHCTQGKSDVACNVTQEAGFIRWYCYRCNKGGRIGATGMTFDSMKKRFYSVLKKNKYHRVVQRKPDLPTDCEAGNWPDLFNMWVWKYELDPNDLTLIYDFQYSKSYDRLIVPVYDTSLVNPASQGKLVGWAGRSEKKPYHPTRNPKWSTRRGPETDHLLWSRIGPNKDVVVIVEDIISAIKIHMAGYSAVALIKSFVPPELILRLSGHKTILWLDYDMLNKIHRKLAQFRTYGCTVTSITTTKDPKAYGLDRIEEEIRGCNVLHEKHGN